MHLNRRTAIKGAVGGALVAGPFAGFANAAALSRTGALAGAAVGTLVEVADARDGVIRLHLPPGFAYRSFHDTSTPVTLRDGTRLPGRHDGMGAFPGPDGSSCWSATTRSTTRSRRSAPPRRTTSAAAAARPRSG